MKTLFAVLAIFICPTFAFGDTIGPSTGCANSAFVGDTYSLNPIYPGKQIAVDCILGVADFSDRTANLITGRGEDLDPLALSSKIPISRMRLRHVDGGLHEWSSETVNEKSLGYGRSVDFSKAAAHVWEPLLTTHKSSDLGDEEQSDLLARNTTDDFYPYAGSFAKPASLNSSKDSRDNRDSNKKMNNPIFLHATRRTTSTVTSEASPGQHRSTAARTPLITTPRTKKMTAARADPVRTAKRETLVTAERMAEITAIKAVATMAEKEAVMTVEMAAMMAEQEEVMTARPARFPNPAH